MSEDFFKVITDYGCMEIHNSSGNPVAISYRVRTGDSTFGKVSKSYACDVQEISQDMKNNGRFETIEEANRAMCKFYGVEYR